MLLELFVSIHMAFRTSFAKDYICLGSWLLLPSTDVVCEMPGHQPCTLTWYFWHARALRLYPGFRRDDSDFSRGMTVV